MIEAGRTLAQRRQKGGYLASFIGPQSTFLDITMNVAIVFWAARETGDDALRQVALEHSRTSARCLVRPDGGTAHEGIFDVDSGRFLWQSTHQGWRADSTWSRGLAWALYGFTAAHRLSGENEFLVTRAPADYHLRRTPAGLVPFWDYDLPGMGHTSGTVPLPPSLPADLGPLRAGRLGCREEPLPGSSPDHPAKPSVRDEFLARRRPDGKAY